MPFMIPLLSLKLERLAVIGLIFVALISGFGKVCRAQLSA
jgi:hypothetical protein